ncbi:L10-interacting MYB domain-containing protein-like [Papaver somniferum]|nr:L10-interacting MYB domain-containing protein-like [Papaver somniferum]
MLLLSSKGSTSHEDDLVLENSSASVVASNCDLLKQILLCVPMKPLMLFKFYAVPDIISQRIHVCDNGTLVQWSYLLQPAVAAVQKTEIAEFSIYSTQPQFSMEKKEDEQANKITFRSVPESRGLFIDQCLAQATEYGFSGTSLKQTSWGNLCKFFSEKYDCTITQKKLRNHWDYLRTQYVTWSRLLARTDHGYNAETNTFDWSEEQWIKLDKTIKNASQFKNKGLEDAEKLQNLFDGKFSTGANRDTPGRVEPPCSAGTSTTAGVSNNGSESRTSHGKEKKS